ncbi:MAG: hypothetical protein HYV59_12750 [Planctomycetes bacterium]|nr:hypothetical protein [Planctomycetota bacterium]
MLNLFTNLQNYSDYFSVFKDAKYVMHDYWKKPNKKIEEEHFATNLPKFRSDSYFNNKGIEIFQFTISCPKFDADGAVLLLKDWHTTGSISILDIGGGDGLFTANLLEGLLKQKQGTRIEKIHLIDPVDFSARYKTNLNKIIHIDPNKTIYTNSNYEDYDAKAHELFDLIIASHSLYSIIDNKKLNVEKLIKKVNSSKKECGKALIILASKEGRAYTFKEEALTLLFGENLKDTNSKDFNEEINGNYLTKYLNEYYTGNSENLKTWLSYFLRFNIDDLDNSNLLQIINLLITFVQPLYELSNDQIKHFIHDQHYHALDINNSLILTHKTEVIVF